MLTYLEHVGLVSIFEKEIAKYVQLKKEHESNVLKEQNSARCQAAIRAAEVAEERLAALQWSLDQVNRIKHEYS